MTRRNDFPVKSSRLTSEPKLTVSILWGFTYNNTILNDESRCMFLGVFNRPEWGRVHRPSMWWYLKILFRTNNYSNQKMNELDLVAKWRTTVIYYPSQLVINFDHFRGPSSSSSSSSFQPTCTVYKTHIRLSHCRINTLVY